jgi:hypothetical protein
MPTQINKQIKSFSLPVRQWSLRKKKTPLPESARKRYRPSDRRLTEKLLTTFEDTGCHVVRVTDHYGRILGFF